jgi:hypothetical protein
MDGGLHASGVDGRNGRMDQEEIVWQFDGCTAQKEALFILLCAYGIRVSVVMWDLDMTGGWNEKR